MRTDAATVWPARAAAENAGEDFSITVFTANGWIASKGAVGAGVGAVEDRVRAGNHR